MSQPTGPSDDGRTFVIVGASLTGAKAAETLREEGFTGRVVLIGEEPDPPYERPPLSKGYLIGTDERSQAFVHEPDWYPEHDIELRTGVRAEAVDRAAREVVLAGGERLPYDALLLATGATPRTLPVPGADLDGVHTLRVLGDCEALREALTDGARAVIVGGGWIGMEVAAAARQRGASVVLAELDELPLRRVLGDDMGRVFADLHRENGVDLRLGCGVSEIKGSDGRVSSVTLTDGSVLPADVVIVGIGIRPAVGLAESAGLAVDNGILVDAALRTSDPAIFAAGDVANAYHPGLGTRVRVEHWANALNGGPAAARSMLGQDVVYDPVPYFFSDQYDLGMEYCGYVPEGGADQLVIRGDLAAREFVACWLRDGRLLAGMNVNVWDVSDDMQRLIRDRTPVDPGRLADPSIPLTEVG